MFWRLFAPVEQISTEELQRSLNNKEACIVLDVREPDEYAAGHVPGAMLIPLGELRQRMSELPKDQTIYAICQTGARSAMAVKLLNAQGFTAKNVAGGIVSWKGRLER